MATRKAAKKTTKTATRKTTKKTAAKKTSGKATGKRELIAPNGDKRLVRRDTGGQFKESDDLGKSLSQDVNKKARTTVKPGQGDKGDQKKKTK